MSQTPLGRDTGIMFYVLYQRRHTLIFLNGESQYHMIGMKIITVETTRWGVSVGRRVVSLPASTPFSSIRAPSICMDDCYQVPA